MVTSNGDHELRRYCRHDIWTTPKGEGREEPLKAPSRPTNVGDGECEGREKEGGRDGIDVWCCLLLWRLHCTPKYGSTSRQIFSINLNAWFWTLWIIVIFKIQSIDILWLVSQLVSFLYFLDWLLYWQLNARITALGRINFECVAFLGSCAVPSARYAALCNKAIDCHSKGLLGRDTTMPQQPRMSYSY